MLRVQEYQTRNKAREAAKKEKKAKQGLGKKTFLHPDKMTRFTFWVSAFTGCLAFIAFIQAWAFVQSERAYISPVAIRFENGGIVAGKPLTLHMELKNSGHSTATISIANVTYHFGPLPTFPVYNLRGTTSLPPITPGAIINSFHNFFFPRKKPFILPPAAFAAINDGKIPFYAFGFIAFTDDFSVFGRRRVGFCFVYNPKGSMTAGWFNNCAEKNYTYSEGDWFKY
jgi:hypothetical protein